MQQVSFNSLSDSICRFALNCRHTVIKNYNTKNYETESGTTIMRHFHLQIVESDCQTVGIAPRFIDWMNRT
jgi:hypothetical protein